MNQLKHTGVTIKSPKPHITHIREGTIVTLIVNVAMVAKQ